LTYAQPGLQAQLDHIPRKQIVGMLEAKARGGNVPDGDVGLVAVGGDELGGDSDGYARRSGHQASKLQADR
jgi:hypothetical protein